MRDLLSKYLPCTDYLYREIITKDKSALTVHVNVLTDSAPTLNVFNQQLRIVLVLMQMMNSCI